MASFIKFPIDFAWNLFCVGESTSSTQKTDRLSTGALVEELELKGDRLHYKLKKLGEDTLWCAELLYLFRKYWDASPTHSWFFRSLGTFCRYFK